MRRSFMKSTTSLIVIAVLAAALVASGCSRNQASSEAKAEAKAGLPPPPPVDVTTAAAITRNLQRGVEVVGSLAADEEVVISAQAPGELEQLNVDFGGYVARGQIIAQIDQRDAKLKVDQAEDRKSTRLNSSHRCISY